jgi:hypothetical protein
LQKVETSSNRKGIKKREEGEPTNSRAKSAAEEGVPKTERGRIEKLSQAERK